LPSNRHKIITAAIWDIDDIKMKFNVASNSQSSSLLDFGTHRDSYPKIEYTKEIEVITKRLDTLLANSDIPNFINLDIQGAELKAIMGLGKLIDKLDYIYTEVNWKQVYLGCANILDLDNYLCEKGFKRVITRRQKLLGWGDAFYIRSSVRKSRSFLQYMNCSLLQFEYIVLQSIKIRTLYTYLRNKF